MSFMFGSGRESAGRSISRSILLLLMEFIVGGSLLLSLPVYWYWFSPESLRAGWYPLIDAALSADRQPVLQVEITRWLVVVAYLVAVWRVTEHSSHCFPIVVRAFYEYCERLEHGLDRIESTPSYPDSGSSASVLALRYTMHLLTVNWPYLSWSMGLCALYLLVLHLFPYEHDTRPWQFFLERSVFLALVTALLVLGEKTVLVGVESAFQKQTMKERVERCMYATWIVRNINEFIKHAQQLQGVASCCFDQLMTSTKLAWTKKSFPSHLAIDPAFAAIVLKESSPAQQNTAAKPQQSNRIYSFFRRAFEAKDLAVIFSIANANCASEWLNGMVPLEKLSIPSGLRAVGQNEDAKDTAISAASLEDTVTSWNEFSLKAGSGPHPSQTMQLSGLQVTQPSLNAALTQLDVERRELIEALSTHASLIRKFDRVMLGVLTTFILYFLTLPIFEVNTKEMFKFSVGISLAPTIAAFSLSFGESIKSIGAAIIYIVTCHPYDIGDRVSIDGADFFVERIGLIATVFRRYDGFAVWIPNYVLAQKELANIRRSGKQSQCLEIQLSADSTPLNKINELTDRVRGFIRHEQKDFDAVVSSHVRLDPATNRFAICFLLKHKFNFQDGPKRADRQNKFLIFVKETMQLLGIAYQPPTIQVQPVRAELGHVPLS